MASTSTIASLVVTLGANSAELVAELDKTRKKANGWGDVMEGTAKGVAIGITAVGAAAAGTSVYLLGMVNDNAAVIDSLAKTSDKLGVTTQALQQLRYQGELSGVAMGTTDMALQRMTRRVAEAAQGTGEAKDAIKELGLSAADLARMSPDQQFYAIAEAMKAVENQGDRVRLAMKLFDSEGVALVNTLASDLDAAAAKFDSLGAAITRQQAAIVESYNDTRTNIDYLFGAFGEKLTVYMAGPLDEVLKYIEKVIQQAGGMDAVAQSVAIGMVNIFAAVIKGAGEVLRYVNDIKIGFKEIQLFDAEFKKRQVAIAGTLGFDVDLTAFHDALRLEKEIAELEKYDAKLDETVQTLLNLPNNMKSSVLAGIDAGKTSSSTPDGQNYIDSIASAPEANSEAYQKLIAEYDETAAAQQKHKKQIDEINAAQITEAEKKRLLAEETKRYNEQLKQLTETQLGYNAAVDGSGNRDKVLGYGDRQMNDGFQQAARMYQNSMDAGNTDQANEYLGRMETMFQDFARRGLADEFDMGAMRQYLEEAKSSENQQLMLDSQNILNDSLITLNESITKLNEGLIGGAAGAKSLGSFVITAKDGANTASATVTAPLDQASTLADMLSRAASGS
ncbi:hypothetical protein [Marinobacterium lutimaris]|uniref:Phospholipid N-methyltransferase n=1 Tax=Marinobacterium lutimaris TaxID=568106 RepID=A0A1H5Y9F3_9GAMM|nr:hypothetical protein [Marinobacterium lutimaris]SEG20267.1 Phospholipid N-methyltransferase [Marinobacterium lutimaris]